jgi:hypothetical protein
MALRAVRRIVFSLPRGETREVGRFAERPYLAKTSGFFSDAIFANLAA